MHVLRVSYSNNVKCIDFILMKKNHSGLSTLVAMNDENIV